MSGRNRRRRVAALGLAAALAAGAARAQLDWRFGIEDTWSQLGGLLTPVQKDGLARKMAAAVAPQSAGGDVNVNGLAGGWAEMQPGPGQPVRFAKSDELVRLLQRHGFSMLWNLRINATWASAGNAGCYHRDTATDCAPDAAHEEDLYDYVRAVAERYDGDGTADMGSETPGNPSDDLRIPVRFFLMTGEIEFAGATPPPQPGYGDAARNHFWSDTIDNLLRTHRIVYRAIHDADPSGQTRLVSSGGVFWDLYADFPDWPATEGPTVKARLAGANNHDAVYTASFERLRKMLRSFGDDADGVECDLVGWHPHMPWREVEQAFAFIRQEAGDKPIYVDDMWTNIFLQDRPDAPGNTLFTLGGTPMEGDFPNALVPSYQALKRGVVLGGPARDWYFDRTARHLVKAFVSAFGEGAERVSFSGNADFAFDRGAGITGWLNLLGSFGEGFPERPAFFAYRQLVEKLHDFTAVEELRVSADPRTRVYRFARPRGPLFVAWSETGPAPPGLDYRIANGETVDIPVGGERVGATRFLATTKNRRAEVAALAAPGGTLRLRLGYEPVLLEPAPAAGCVPDAEHLCLAGGRFRVGVRWRTPAGESGAGQAAAITADTGTFSFFDLDNLEVVVKVLDACPTPFARFWVFATGLTDVGTTLEVEDVVSGTRRAYFTAPGQSFPPLQDTDAFPVCD